MQAMQRHTILNSIDAITLREDLAEAMQQHNKVYNEKDGTLSAASTQPNSSVGSSRESSGNLSNGPQQQDLDEVDKETEPLDENIEETLSKVWDGGAIKEEADKHGAQKTGHYGNKCGINPYLVNI